MTDLALSFLGLPRIARGGVPVLVDRSKAVALLAYLALTERQHTRDALAALLWPEHNQVRARANLRRALAAVRAAIPGEWWDVNYESLGLRAGSFDLDIHAFRRLITCAEHDHPAHGTCPACVRSLEEAVALYRGDFLAGFGLPDCPEFEEWRFLQAEELRREYAHALERLAAALAMQRAFPAAITYAQRWVALDTLNERAQRQLMQLYALAGQRGAALAQYERCRRILAEELNCVPEEATTALYRKIREGDIASPSLDADPSPATIPPAHPLPLIGPLIGRERERAALRPLLADPAIRLITLVGPGGIGKTHLGIQMAADQRELFADGVHFVSLAPLSSVDLLVSTIVDSLPFAVDTRHDPLAQLLEALRDRSMLLVLDNFEHLLDGAAVIAVLLQHAPNVTCLVTSRERLNLSEEWVFPVDGLEVPEESAGVDIEECDAVRLFVQSARKAATSFSMRPEEYPLVAHICRYVEGMPLAIELAASWVPVLSCAEIAREIARNLDLLATNIRDTPERHRSIRAVFDHSWQLLTEHERDVFMRLSVFRGGFTRGAAEAVAGASLPALSALVRKSLLRKDASGQYEIHELLRQYAIDRLETNAQDARDARDRHCHYYLAFLARQDERLKTHDRQMALEEIGAELANVRAAWQWAIERGEAEQVARAADGLWLFYAEHGWIWEIEAAFSNTAAFERTARAAGVDDDLAAIAIGKMLTRYGSCCLRLGRYDRAMEALEQSVALFRRLGDQRELGFALNLLAGTVHMLGQYTEERQLLQESIASSRAAGDQWGMAYSLNDLALVSHLLGTDAAAAQQLARESLAIFHQIGDQRGMAFALNNLGEIATHLGAYAEAAHLHEASLAARRATGDQWGIAYSLHQLGILARLTDDRQAANARLLEALRTAAKAKLLPMVLDVLVELATLRTREGKPAAARDILDAVLRHPALSRRVRDNAEYLRAELPPMQPRQWETAMPVNEIVAALVQSGEPDRHSPLIAAH